MSPRPKANSERTNVFFSPEVMDTLKSLAAEKGTSVSGLIRMIVLEYLAEKKIRVPAARQSNAETLNHPEVSQPSKFIIPRWEPPRNKKKEVFKNMSKIEKMKRYIERTKMSASTTSLYKMNVLEAFELAYQALECRDLPIEAISLAFDYGKAKGYRATKAEGRAAV